MIGNRSCQEFRKHLRIAKVLLLAGLFLKSTGDIAASGATLENGNFEKSPEGQPTGWEIVGSGVSVKPFSSAVWTRYRFVFNSAEYPRVRIWLGMKGGTGAVWFDNVRVEESEFSNQTITNRSFEEGDAKTITGWIQDPPNGSIRDTTHYERFPGQAEGSGASARVTSADGKPSRIGQDIRIVGRKELNREFVLSFDCRLENMEGPPSVEVIGVGEDGQLGRSLPLTPYPSRFAPAKFGKNVAALSLEAPGQSGLTQKITLSADEQNQPWQVSAQVRVPKLDHASIILSVQSGPDPISESQVEITSANDAWQEISLNFIAATTAPQVAILIKGERGSAFVDNLTIGPAKIVPSPKRLDWLPVSDSFSIAKKLTISVKGDTGPVVASAIRLFSESLEAKTSIETEWDKSGRVDKPDIAIAVRSADRTEAVPESYSIKVDREGVSVESADARGVLNGLMTLLELVQRTPGGASVFLAAKIDDAPDLPFRAEYWAGDGPGHDGSFRPLLDRLARLRYNAVFVENYPYFSLENAEARRQTEEFFAYARNLGIEPVPVLQSFGHAYQVQTDPNVAEGQEVENEKLVLAGTNPVPLAHPNVIRTETSNIRITDETGRRTFLEGLDYVVIPGEIGWKDSHGFSSNAAPFQVRRTAVGRIPDGATVLAGYDYVSMATGDGTQPAYCPNEPRVYWMMGEGIRNTIRILHPKYLSIGHDEIMQMGTDSRCRKSGRSNAENLAKEVWDLYRIAKAEDPKLCIMMWDDMIDPYTHGYFANYPYLENSLQSPFLQAGQLLKDPTAPAADLLPRDIVIHIWIYGATDPLTAGAKSLEFFSKKGYRTIGCCYANIENARGWSIACKNAKDEGFPCMGVLHTSWSEQYGSLEESGNTAWRVPSEP